MPDILRSVSSNPSSPLTELPLTPRAKAPDTPTEQTPLLAGREPLRGTGTAPGVPKALQAPGTTACYVADFNRKHDGAPLSKWMHDHPTLTTSVQIALVLVGAGAGAAFPLILPAAGLTAAVLTAVAAGLLVTAVALSKAFTHYGTCAAPVPCHTVKEGVHAGGRLTYRGTLPVLELSVCDPQLAGQAHGYLLGAHIYDLKSNLEFLSNTILRKPRAADLPRTMSQLKQLILPEYWAEMAGIAEGYNRWATEARIKSTMTVEDVALLHLIPDVKHFNSASFEQQLRRAEQAESGRPASVGNLLAGLDPAPACTSILYKDADGTATLGRNMDWVPFGQGGAKSILIVRPATPGKKATAALGVPGMIGVVTGWNQDKLCLAMNVCPGKTTTTLGMPAILHNRNLLETASTVSEVVASPERPLGAYHLTVMDAKHEGACVSYFQNSDVANYQRVVDTHVRQLDATAPVVTLNWCEPIKKGGFFNSATRYALLNKYFGGAKERITEPVDAESLVGNALRLKPYINSWITIHSLVFSSKEGTVSIRRDNGYAPSATPTHLDLAEVFAPADLI